jgi:hypothetical protein
MDAIAWMGIGTGCFYAGAGLWILCCGIKLFTVDATEAMHRRQLDILDKQIALAKVLLEKPKEG